MSALPAGHAEAVMDDANRARLARFFTDYAWALTTGDADAIAAAYADTYIEAEPGAGMAVVNDDALRSALRDRHEFMTRELGFQSAEVLAVAPDDLAPGHATADVLWRLHFVPPDRPASDPEFTITYVLRMGLPPVILLYAAHEPEAEVMRRHGLLDGNG